MPLTVEAQAADKSVKLGYLAAGAAPIFNPIRAQLRERGWIEGQNLAVVFGLWGQDRERARDLAKDLVAADVDVIFAVGPDAAAAAKEATTTIPIVMLFSIDPVGSGLAQSLTRPGGNVTGLLWDTGAEDYSAKMNLRAWKAGRSGGHHVPRTVNGGTSPHAPARARVQGPGTSMGTTARDQRAKGRSSPVSSMSTG